MKAIRIALRIIAALGILIGVDFRIQHYPYGKEILLLSVILFAFSYLHKLFKK